MEGGKKVAIAVVLILIIVAAVVWQLKSSGTIGGPQPPQWVLERKSWKIDNKTLESKELMYKEWRSLGHKEGKYKNPDTGEYTMVPRMKCAACEEWIPGPEMPRIETTKGQPGDPDQMEDRMAQEEKIMREYKCPKCSKLAMPEMGPPR